MRNKVFPRCVEIGNRHARTMKISLPQISWGNCWHRAIHGEDVQQYQLILRFFVS